MPFPIVCTAFTFVALCILIDIRTRRIPNPLSGAAMLAGTALNALYFGVPGLVTSIGGLLIIVAVLLWAFALGGIGGGDVKMMAAIGALLGPRLALTSLAFGMLLGGVIMIVHLARLGRLREKLRTIGTMFSSAVLTL